MAKQLAGAQPAELVFVLTNTGQDAVQFLNWQTPFEGIKAPMFTILRDGNEVEYRGRMFKRGAPKKDDYLLLQAGEKRETKVDLADGWDVAASGKYTVDYSAELFDVMSGSAAAPRALADFQAMPLRCGSVTFTRLR